MSSASSCLLQTGEKKLDWKHNTDEECDIGSVLHKEGSPPSNVNTAVHVCCHLWLLPFYLKPMENFPPKTNEQLFLQQNAEGATWTCQTSLSLIAEFPKAARCIQGPDMISYAQRPPGWSWRSPENSRGGSKPGFVFFKRRSRSKAEANLGSALECWWKRARRERENNLAQERRPPGI